MLFKFIEGLNRVLNFKVSTTTYHLIYTNKYEQRSAKSKKL